MPASGKVSIFWQIIFVVFVPVANIWAFYRVKKLQKGILYLAIPEVVLIVLSMVFMLGVMSDDGELFSFEDIDESGPDIEGISIAISIIATVGGTGLSILAIYLIFKWSEEWNKQFTQ
jgi:hypothetical protein